MTYIPENESAETNEEQRELDNMKSKPPILTLQKLKDLQPSTVFAHGETTNSPDGIYMTDSNYNKPLLWIAQRGDIHDWTIYIGWKENGFTSVLLNGDKVTSKENIKKLVPCDDEALKMYRY